jgi:hypothetical protein
MRRVDSAAEKHRTHKNCQGPSARDKPEARKIITIAAQSLVCGTARAYETKAIDRKSPA